MNVAYNKTDLLTKVGPLFVWRRFSETYYQKNRCQL